MPEQSTTVRDESAASRLQLSDAGVQTFTSTSRFNFVGCILLKGKHGNDEKLEAGRVMERIRYLAEETRLKEVNRR